MNWHGGPEVSPDVSWARQSLAPIVWNGQLNPQLNDNPNSPQWGYTLGGLTRVWRSGVPMQSPRRYLVPDDRDFFAVYQPRPGPVTVPFK